MSIYHYFQSLFQRIESLDFHQMALMVVIIVAFGFWCLRGFGSRSNY
jgi:hypothetical protein